MPWQTAPSLLIIMGMFNVTIGLMWTVDRVYYGPKGRRTERDQFQYNLTLRDDNVMLYRKELAKLAAEAKK